MVATIRDDIRQAPKRIVVIGSSCSGKTTLSRRLSRLLQIDHIELDALFWISGWRHRDAENFRGVVRAAVAGNNWIVDGNYVPVRDLVWPKATHIVWLNYSLRLVLLRALKRSIWRGITRQRLFSGNVETLGELFSRNSILGWIVRMYQPCRDEYARILQKGTIPSVEFIELDSPAATRRFLKELAAAATPVPQEPGNPPCVVG